ncbi:MAG: methyltransferase, partial [Deltaproteobacteria bacterium]|nr:methyltransferase [Deltaproteobacteria bacterium]
MLHKQHGRLTICQKKQGFRFSIDSAILAYHVRLKKHATAVDLGTGCGVIALILALRFPDALLYGIEIQKDLARLAAEDVRQNQLEGRVAIICGDIKQSLFRPGWAQAHAVVSNPPYRRLHAGRISPDR